MLRTIRSLTLLALSFLFTLPLLAEEIPINNPSFEDDVLCDGCIRTSSVSGWVVSAGGGDGALNPTLAQYPGGASDGNNVAYANLVGNHVNQTLSTNLEANTTYTLIVDVGRRADETHNGYRVQLRAGGVVLAEDNSSLVPAAGAFVTSTVVYEATEADAQLGQPLEIWLLSLGVQANFDNVRLDAVGECSETWTPGPDMNKARYAFPLVRMSDGQVLAAGGGNSTSSFYPLQTAEILDSAATAWTTATPMPSAHAGRQHGTLLDNGEALIVGYDEHIGSHPHPATAVRYDATGDMWEMTANSPSISRFLASTTLLPDGRVLLVGGYDGHGTGPTYDTAEVYDPVTDTWSSAGTMAEVRLAHSATLLTTGPNAGKVLVAGGAERVPSNTATTGCELYDPTTNMWSATGSLNVNRLGHTATSLPDGRVLVTGGRTGLSTGYSSAEIYDPQTGTWSLTASMSTLRVAHTATSLTLGKVLVAGGRLGSGTSTHLTSVEVYDPATDAWSPVACLNTARSSFNATLLQDGRVLVAGGHDASGSVLTSTEIFTPDDIFADGFESGHTSAWSSTTGLVSCTWTSWLNRDSPSGVGDFETLADFLAMGQACASPIDIECETLGGTDWQTAGEVYTCTTEEGGYCYNSQQPDNQCMDYHVRFLCCEP